MGNICCGENAITSTALPRHAKPMCFSSNSEVNSRSFTVEKILGQGAFGKVLLVRKTDNGKRYAMKLITKGKLQTNRLKSNALTERRILEKVHSPFVVKLRFAFQTEKKLCLVMDYMPGGELFDQLQRVGKFPECRARFHAGEILLALQALHRESIIYRDLKPENVLFDLDGHLKLADFNLSKMLSTEFCPTMTFCGTPDYLAPEVLRREPQDVALDFWAFGAVLYEMLAGETPFADSNRDVMYRKILTGQLTMKPWFSEPAADLLEGLLRVSRVHRLKDVELIQRHPFFAEIDWEMLSKRELSPPSLVTSASESSLCEQLTIDDSPTADASVSVCQSNVFERFTYQESIP